MLIGCCWAFFALMGCDACYSADTFVVFKGATLIVALCVSAMSHFLLPRAIFFAFAPTALALALRATTTHGVFDVSLTATFAAAVIFFSFVTDRLFQSNLKILSFQSQKDDLIAELEVAKSMSDEARRRAEEANLAKSRFLATMSHELRTPLNAILGFSEVMSTEVMGPLNNEIYKEYTNDIHRSGQHLLNLINEILDLSRIEAGKYELSEEAISLLDVAEDCIGMVQLRARGKNISISQQFEPELPAVWADEKSIRQVMLNLLSNAVKFTPRAATSTSRSAGPPAAVSMSRSATMAPAFRKRKFRSCSRPSARVRSPSRAPNRARASACRSSRRSLPSTTASSS